MVEKMSHAPAQCFKLEHRGYLREGYYADLVVVDEKKENTVTKESLLYKCGWSPFVGFTFSHAIDSTFVNGQLVYHQNKVIEGNNGMRLTFAND